ncbi:hypothetical protein [Streptomyces sp. NPDC007856]|uniref:hypothetical protein n=1 Tax=Streptomyces sp. NPDC007856 TaxID=3364781 RepID=UPI0036994517
MGRRPKVYEPVAEAIAVHIPERRHEMPAEVLAEAVVTVRLQEQSGDPTSPSGGE